MKKDQINKITSLLDEAIQIDSVPDELKSKLREAQKEIKSPLDFDVWIYRPVVWFLGAVVVITVIGGVVLASKGNGDPNIAVPQGIIAIGSAAVGALAGLLAPSQRGNS